MGSAPSTPSRERSDDPWWPIENQNLDLNPNAMDRSNSNTSQLDQEATFDSSSNSSTANSVESLKIDQDLEIDVTSTSMSEVSNEITENNVKNAQISSSSSDAKLKISENRQQSLEEFKEELRIKREMRTNAIAELRNEISSLRKQLAEEKELTKQLTAEKSNENLCHICSSIYNSIESHETNETNNVSTESSITLRSHLAEVQFALQNANAEILTLSTELAATKKQAKSLKEVIAASKEIIEIRETELSQLKSKLKEIEESLAEREFHVMSENLRQEYDRQLANIRNLRALYEERARISAAEKENLNRQLETSRAELSSEIEKNKNLEEHIASLDSDLKATSIDLYAAKEKLVYYKSENKDLRDEMAVVNQLFVQLLAGFNGNNDLDIDKLTLMLEENRDLLSDITNRENCKEGAAQIPKLIFDLVSQADKNETDAEHPNETDEQNMNEKGAESLVEAEEPSSSTDGTKPKKLTSAQEIIQNLPKVWRVLIELLNHQQLKPVPLKGPNQQEYCYKSVQTPSGPKMELSVSKTYIRLKDLIMEKKFLQKETKKLKNLNSHLESRLSEKEVRLHAVSVELNKTWNLVGRMQRQHRQLHTHEQVLRYQLQQKRRMLGELKQELEYCRKTWALAKEKNNESQSQWETLRLEFSKRKESINSAESGYSDGPASEEDEDSISLEQPRNSRNKKKLNIEKFLLTADQKERKTLRIHSVSPVRNAKINMSRRNSDSDITQLFATEVFQVASDVVQPIESNICAECGENCVKHSVHFDSNSMDGQQTERVKITEPVIHNAKHEPTNAQKLIEAKASSSKVKMSCQIRKTTNSPKPSKSKAEESLEDMFMRLSNPGASNNENGDETESEVELIETESNGTETNEIETNANESNESEVEGAECVVPVATYEEREAKRLSRIERLEGQCKLLLKQVTRASVRGDELNKRIDDRYTPSRETSVESSSEPQPSTSQQVQDINIQSDEQCLTTTEKEYLSRRDKRLKRLEAEAQEYMNKVKSVNRRATDVDTKLEFLHGRYGNESLETESETSTDSVDNIQPTPVESTQPSTSNQEGSSSVPKSDEDCLTTTEKEYLSRRDERLKRLEAETQAYMNRLKSINGRGTVNLVPSADQSRNETPVEIDSNSTESVENASPSTSQQESTSVSGVSSKTDEECLTETEKEYLARRDERLKRLEAEAQAFRDKVKADVDIKLESLQDQHTNEPELGPISNDSSENAQSSITVQTTLSTSSEESTAELNDGTGTESGTQTEGIQNQTNQLTDAQLNENNDNNDERFE